MLMNQMTQEPSNTRENEKNVIQKTKKENLNKREVKLNSKRIDENVEKSNINPP